MNCQSHVPSFQVIPHAVHIVTDDDVAARVNSDVQSSSNPSKWTPEVIELYSGIIRDKLQREAVLKHRSEENQVEWRCVGSLSPGVDDDDYDSEGCIDPCWQHYSLYTVTRLYGGPEEGGWWYDHLDLVESTKVQRGSLSMHPEYTYPVLQLSVDCAFDYPNSDWEPGIRARRVKCTRGAAKIRVLETIDDADPDYFGEPVEGATWYIEDFAGQHRSHGRPHYC